eukprot:2490625-Pyramimonas_sp.AAC.1
MRAHACTRIDTRDEEEEEDEEEDDAMNMMNMTRINISRNTKPHSLILRWRWPLSAMQCNRQVCSCASGRQGVVAPWRVSVIAAVHELASLEKANLVGKDQCCQALDKCSSMGQQVSTALVAKIRELNNQ